MEKKTKSIRRFNQQYQALSFSELMRKADEEYLEFSAEFDTSGNPVSEAKFGANGMLEERNTYAYFPDGKLREHILHYAIDDVTEKRVLSRDEKGRLTEEVKFYGDDTGERMKYTYDTADRIVAIERFDEEGDFDYKEVITYDDRGEMKSRVKMDAANKPAGSVTFNQLDDHSIEEREYEADGKLSSLTVIKRDAEGRETATIHTNASGKPISAVYTVYDDCGNVLERQHKDFYSKTVKYAYDESNRLIAHEIFDGTGLLLRKHVFEYDEFGNVLTEKVFEIDASRGGRDKHYGLRYEYDYHAE